MTLIEAKTYQAGNCFVLYNPAVSKDITLEQFTPDYWLALHKVTQTERGRGASWFVEADDQEWVLRHYRRGGLVARYIEEHYIWTGLENTRAWLEWKLLAELHDRGFPVPLPVAARVCKFGLVYKGDIITQRIPDALSLAQRLSGGSYDDRCWKTIGETVAKFHKAGIFHADLNAHNIMLDKEGQVFLIDFDRGRKRPAGVWEKTNLDRLHHSLSKLKRFYKEFYFAENNWQELIASYQTAMTS